MFLFHQLCSTVRLVIVWMYLQHAVQSSVVSTAKKITKSEVIHAQNVDEKGKARFGIFPICVESALNWGVELIHVQL